jgi:PA14 domain/Filamin/ABP280 repeat
VQAKDAYGNNLVTGGDDVQVTLVSQGLPAASYRASVQDDGTGVYNVVYTVPSTGTFDVRVTINGDPVQLCATAVTDLLDPLREYSGTAAYATPAGCALSPGTLTVVHGELHEPSCTATGAGLTAAAVGAATSITVQARDSFGNLRDGAGTGDGKSDAFLVTLAGPNGYEVVTSTAVLTVTPPASGTYTLSFAGATTAALPFDASPAVVQAALALMLPDSEAPLETHVAAGTGSNLVITFLNHLDDYSASAAPVTTAPALTVVKAAAGGVYPVSYTAWYGGLYTLTVAGALGGQPIDGSPSFLTVSSAAAPGVPTGSHLTTTVESTYNNGSRAGVEGWLTVQVRDSGANEVQTLAFSAQPVVAVDAVQQISFGGTAGAVTLSFAAQTITITTGTSTAGTIQTAIRALIGADFSTVTVSGGSTAPGSSVLVTFVGTAVAGDVPLITSSDTVRAAVTQTVLGVDSFRQEVQAFTCAAAGSGSFAVTWRGTTATVTVASTTAAQLQTALAAADVTVVSSAAAGSPLCNGSPVFVRFNSAKGALPPLTFSPTAAATLLAKPLPGIAPFWGSFTLSYGKETTAAVGAYATAAEVQAALEALPSVGGVTVTLTYLGAGALYPVYTIAFNGQCKRANSWAQCPANLGDLPLLAVNTANLLWPDAAVEHPARPTAVVLEAVKGTAGNKVANNADLSSLALTLLLNNVPAVGMHEVHTITCRTPLATVLAPGAPQVQLSFGTAASVTVDASVASGALQTTLQTLTGDSTLVVGGVAGPLCAAGATNTFTVTFSSRKLTQPTLAAVLVPSAAASTMVLSIAETTTGVDSVQYIADGLYNISFTPVVAGIYSMQLDAGTGGNAGEVNSDLSKGWTVVPADADAAHSQFDTQGLAHQGKLYTSIIQAIDVYDNLLDGPADGEFFVTLLTSKGVVVTNATVSSSATPNTDGLYTAGVVPMAAGVYSLRADYRTTGGLLATYYRGRDTAATADAVLMNTQDFEAFPYHNGTFCPAGYACDATNVAHSIDFAWGTSAPLPASYGVPADYFAAKWTGHVAAPVSGAVSFKATSNDPVKVTVGTTVVMDTINKSGGAAADAAAVQLPATKGTGTVRMVALELLPISIEYIAGANVAALSLTWRLPGESQYSTVPSSALYYTRQVAGSPRPIIIVAGALNPAASGIGSGAGSGSGSGSGGALPPLNCTALITCSFTITARDAGGNVLATAGADPGWGVTITGSDDWALLNRVNEYLYPATAPRTVPVTVTANDWTLLGTATCTAGDNFCTAVAGTAAYAGAVRGDTVAIGGQALVIDTDATNAFTSVRLPLASPYEGASGTVSIYKTGPATGTYTVTYTPQVLHLIHHYNTPR